MSDTVDELQNNSNNTEDGLRKLNKELLSRNGELIKRLNRMKTERDNFEQLFIDWKKINKDAAEALNLLQKEKKTLQQENNTLHQQINDYKLEIKSLKLQNNERMEQCNLLLRRCNEYKSNQSQSHQSNSQNNGNYNTLKFNYQQKKNEMDQILFQIQKLFNFCHTNYPQIYNNYNQQNMYHLNDIQEYEYNDDGQSDEDEDGDDDDGLDDDFSSLKQRKNRKKIGRFTAKTPKKHRSTKSLSDFDKNVFRKRRSLNYIYENKKHQNKLHEKQNMKKKDVVNIMINNNKPKTMKQPKITRKIERENVDRKISPELLGPTTSYNQYDNKRSDPFGRTLSSHSFFSEQRYRYNQVQLNMTNNSKLWSKRDSLTRKRKQPRINAIPSSAGNTPLTTPQQSYRGKLSDDDDDDEHDMYFDEDPHQKYLEMMGDKNSSNNNNKPKTVPTTSTTSAPTASAAMTMTTTTAMATRSKLTDKKTIHDLFDMLQQQTLSSSSPATHSTNSTMTTNTENTSTSNEDMDAIREFYDDQLQNNSDAQLVPLPEPSDSSSDSSDSD